TISYGDWSSDVCSSDLNFSSSFPFGNLESFFPRSMQAGELMLVSSMVAVDGAIALLIGASGRAVKRTPAVSAELITPWRPVARRSEERRVGKGGRSGGR